MNKEEQEEFLKKLLNVSNVIVGAVYRRKNETSKSTNKRRNKKSIKGVPTIKTRR